MSEAVITFPLLGEKFSLDFKPYFTVFGHPFYWYGVIIAIGFLLAVFYTVKRSKQFGLTEDNVIDLLIFTVPLAIICARAYYVIFSWDDYKDNISDIFKIWNGGLAIYGGIIGAVIGLIIYSRVKKIKFWAAADLGSLGLLIGQAIGRWGNFTNREAYGIKTTVPWKMGLTNQWGTFYYHPCFLYESLWNALGLLILHFYSKKRKFDGEVFLLYLLWYGIGRMIIEGLRTDSLYLFGSNLRVSQLLALLTAMVALGCLIYLRLAKNFDPENLWVNHDQKAKLEKAGEEQAEKMFGTDDDQNYDEDFADALNILKNGNTMEDEDEDFNSDSPVVEPIDVDIDDSSEENKLKNEEPEENSAGETTDSSNSSDKAD